MRASIVPQWNKCRRCIAIATAVMAVGAALLVSLSAFVESGDARATREDAGDASVTRTAKNSIAGGEPEFSRREHEVLWSDDFEEKPRARVSRSASEAGRLGRYITIGDPFVRHDPVGGVDGSGGIRMDWQPAPGNARCNDDSRLLEASFEPATELFIQFSVRYTPGFVFDWSRHRRCAGNAKKLFLLWAQEGSRFVFISENGALGIGSDHDHPLFAQNQGGRGVRPAELADGRWHRITFHIRQSSTSDRPDGFVRGWIDGVERWDHRGIVTHNARGYNLFKFPATFNQGSPVAQSEWVDALRLWRPR